ncbi:TetR/AcrR family transcriptional regulator C-terminal domain-containing protein [Gottfriedia acidiceleris]|uniref:TetR/AcrR family transcriptional regulator n=1 Tax=Bacillaceae TaxID=186817 RepID=UPI000BEDD905|nr:MULTISPECIES: TetR/AcrR family transcriptional regulator [unclassified Bacillus (in: firmicutes)]PEC50465.1 TetR family transcriptional regulator [Bacillus sp. AFS096315]PFM82003.1 TetR family transcriptional regulator [Bacillus sp. AFS077874]
MSIKNNLDPRVIRTRQLLQDALITLLADKEFEAISVQDITKKANVNRATFYSHYEDKYQMVRQIVREKLVDLDSAMKNVDFSMYDGNPNSLDEMALKSYFHLFEHIEKNSYFYKVLLKRQGPNIFRRRLYEVLSTTFEKGIAFIQPKKNKYLVPGDLLVSYISGATLSVISFWVENDMPYTKKHMAEYLLKISRNGVLTTAGLESN